MDGCMDGQMGDAVNRRVDGLYETVLGVLTIEQFLVVTLQ